MRKWSVRRVAATDTEPIMYAATSPQGLVSLCSSWQVAMDYATAHARPQSDSPRWSSTEFY